MRSKTRRSFVRQATAGAAVTALGGLQACNFGWMLPDPAEPPAMPGDDPWFRISLAEWSLHRTLGTDALDNLGFITATRRDYDIDAVEYVNTFFFDQAENADYLKAMTERCDGEGVRSLLIMCDNEGRIGDPDDAARTLAVENHYKWVQAAAFLGCHSIRVNAASEGDWAEQSRLAADGLNRLAQYAASLEINVLVENHGGLSSNAVWLTETIGRADHPALGTLPDFGNFRIAEDDWYDMYRGVEELMPLARAVSAKTHDFDDDGNEADKNYLQLLTSVRDAGYRGWIGIEYEGTNLPEPEGIRRSKALLERCRGELAP